MRKPRQKGPRQRARRNRPASLQKQPPPRVAFKIAAEEAASEKLRLCRSRTRRQRLLKAKAAAEDRPAAENASRGPVVIIIALLAKEADLEKKREAHAHSLKTGGDRGRGGQTPHRGSLGGVDAKSRVLDGARARRESNPGGGGTCRNNCYEERPSVLPQSRVAASYNAGSR